MDRKSQSHDVTAIALPTLSEIGISKMQSSCWQSIAAIPEQEFEQVVREIKEKPG